MKIFEVAGEGKLHGLTVMSLDKFVKKEDDVEESDMSGVMHAAKNYNRSFLITAELAEGGKKTFRVRAQSERVAREKFEQHHNQARIVKVKEEGVDEASKELPQWKKDWYAKQKPNSWPKHPQPYHNPNWMDELSPEEREKLTKGGLKEFAPAGGGDGDSGQWYTDDELADIIGDDWFEDFDVSNDGFNIDAYGEKAKKNLVGYANSWFDDKGYNVNVMGVEHNDVDHDLKWYIVGSFQNDNFAKKDLEEVDRRGFLKGIGAAAVAGAAGYKMGQDNNSTPVSSSTLSGADLRDPRVSYLIGFFYWCQGTFGLYKQQENRESLKIQQDIKKWIKDWDAEENHWDKGLDNNEKSTSLRMRKERQLGQKEAYDWFYHEIYKESDPKGTFERFMSRVKYEHSKLLNWNKSRQESVNQGVAEDNSAVIANTADRLSNKDDGRTAKLRAAGDARREQHLKGRDIAKSDRSSKDAWGDLKERASQLLSAEDRNGVITVIVQAPDGTKKSLANDNPNYINQWLSAKYGLTLPKSITSKFAGMNEAPGDFGLGANYRAVPDDEMQDLMGRSKNKTKTKRDKFDYPYIHGSNIEVKDEAGKKFDTEKLKAAIMTRPANILGQNAKMQHSETGTEAIFDIGLPALKGLAVNEKTGEFVVVDTCPGAGACMTYCYAMKGSYVMFKAVSMGLARMLNFLLNDPAGFADKLNSEIASARSKYAKKGARIVVRWHDAGDFFSPEYMDMAYGVARANPDVGFYAYTKMGDVANAARPANFNMNFSQGAKTGQEKKVNITRTKHSKVVPKDMFFDLIARKGNELIKDAKGRMQFASPENMDKFKTTMATKYAIDKDSILTYDQMMKTPVGDTPKWNVIVMPGDGDNSANRNDVIGSYLLFH